MGATFSQLKYRMSDKYQSLLWNTFAAALRLRIGILLDTLRFIGASTLPTDPVDGTNPLMHYSLCGEYGNVQLLAPRYRDQIDSSAMGGQTALHAAATSGSLACCSALWENGADIDKQSDRGHSALMIACSLGHLDIVRELLNRGAEADMFDVDLKTAQHFSVKSEEATRLVLKATKGKLLSARDTNGKTPLMVAIMLGGEDEVFEALMQGVDEYFSPNRTSKVVNVQSNDGMTALMHACHRGLSKATNRLLKAGSDASLRDAYGQTALHLAAKARQVGIMSMLLDAMTDNSAQQQSKEEEPLIQMRDDDGLLAIHCVVSGLTSSTEQGQGKLACDCLELLLKVGGKTAVQEKDFSDTTALHLIIQAFFQTQTNNTVDGLLGSQQNISEWYVEYVCLMIKLMIDCMQGEAWKLLLAEDESGWTCFHYVHEYIKKIKDTKESMTNETLSIEKDEIISKNIEREPVVDVRQPVIDLMESLRSDLNKSCQPQLDLQLEKRPKSKYLELRGAYQRIPIEERDDVLRGNRTLKGIAEHLLRSDLPTDVQAKKEGKKESNNLSPHKIVVLCGAGISTSAGIPDYRSNSGIYKTKAGRDAFSSFHEEPKLFWNFARQTFGPIIKGEIKPTASHHFLAQLHRRGMLQRVYTQNVDGLEVRAGVPQEKLVQCHGSINTVSCSACAAPPRDSTPVFFPPQGCSEGSNQSLVEPADSSKGDNDQLPLCEVCSSPLRPDVTFFGEPLSAAFFTHQNEDFDQCTMLIVMGTTLQVFPFASLVGKPSLLTPRLLINQELTGPFRQLDDGCHKYRDVAFLGACDEGVKELGSLLGWEESEWLK